MPFVNRRRKRELRNRYTRIGFCVCAGVFICTSIYDMYREFFSEISCLRENMMKRTDPMNVFYNMDGFDEDDVQEEYIDI